MANPPGRGAQVVLDGYAQAVARGAIGPRLVDNMALQRALQDADLAGTLAAAGAPNDAASEDDLARTAALAKLQRLAAQAARGNALTLGAASGVTVTSPASGDGTLSQLVAAAANAGASATPGRFAFHGGTATQFPGQAWLLFPVSDIAPQTGGNVSGYLPSTPTVNAWTWEAEFVTDAPTLEAIVLAFPGLRFRVLVDGQYAGGLLALNAETGAQRIRLVFSGGRKPRRVQIRSTGPTGFQGVFVGPSDTVWAPPATDTVLAAVTGDSFGEGIGTSSPADPDAPYPLQLGHLMGWSDVRQVAVGATGYLANGGVRSTVREQIARWGFIPDVIVCASGYNDQGSGFTPEATAGAALLTWQIMRLTAPRARIFVVGPWIGNRTAASMLPTETALSVAFARWNDGASHFIPVAGDASPWTTGTGRQGATTGNGNADIYMSTDGLHLNDAGHAYHAARMTNGLRAAIGIA
jgi:lysophospholipase L1-like esterase